MIGAVEAGGVYFALVFTAGFALGAARTLLVAPRLGATAAVLIECPIILGVSWIACRWSLDRLDAPATVSARLTMGAVAFALLMAAELGVSVLVFRRPIGAHFAAYRTAPGAIGLAAQGVFAVLPLVQLLIWARVQR